MPHIAQCNCYRCPYGLSYPECGLPWAMRNWLRTISERVTSSVHCQRLTDLQQLSYVGKSNIKQFLSAGASPMIDNRPSFKGITHHGTVHRLAVTHVTNVEFHFRILQVIDMLDIDFRKDWIEYYRRKTKNKKSGESKTAFSIQPEAREIINKYNQLRSIGKCFSKICHSPCRISTITII